MRDAPTHEINGTSQSYKTLTHSNTHDDPSSPGISNPPTVIHNPDSFYLSPYKNGGLRPPLNASRSGSEADSLLDLYGRPRSGVESMDKVERPGTMGDAYVEDEDPERSRWIHRDKLLAIENQEMQEAGIRLPRSVRSNSKSQRPRENSRDQYRNGLRSHELNTPNTTEAHHQRFEPPAPQEEQDEEPSNHDLRTPEEIWADSRPEYSPPIYNQPRLRSSSSRIPLPRDSPLPIPQEHIERNIPIPRKRGASANWGSGDDNGIAYNKVRRRSQSVGSLVLLDDGEPLPSSPTPGATFPESSPSTSTSPSKARVTSKSGLSSGSRRISGTPRNATDPQKTRSPATPRVVSGQRPQSRSGLTPRPATAINRPEGDPPWLATMFKPDPRLPPEQQLLPTHAKKLQEEQQHRENEGKPESKIRKAFTPLAVHTNSGLQPPSPAGSLREEGESGKENKPGWPLQALSSATKGNTSPGLPSPSPNAGYSTIPKLQGTPQLSRAPSPKPMVQAMPMQEVQKEKSCGCCVVM